MEQLPNAGVLMIGVGSVDRGDDAAGRLAAQQIMANHPNARFRTKELRGEAMELMDAWAGADTVILIDAMAMGLTPGSVRRFDASTQALPAEMARASTHDIGVCEAIELARAMGILPRRVILYGIEIARLTHGGEPCDQVKAGIWEAADAAVNEANKLLEGKASHA